MGHILTYQKDFYEPISNLIHLSLVIELTYIYLIAGNGHFLKIDNFICFHMALIYESLS
jgi:hypothetical protein